MSKKEKRRKLFTAILAGVMVLLMILPMVLGALEAMLL